MGLLNRRTINKVKHLALKNKDKIADNVTKATDALDKRTGGKHHDKLQKLDDAAAKFAGRPPDADESGEESGDESGEESGEHDAEQAVDAPTSDPATSDAAADEPTT